MVGVFAFIQLAVRQRLVQVNALMGGKIVFHRAFSFSFLFTILFVVC